MARYRHSTSGALVSVREDKVLGSEWERLDAGADDAPAEPAPTDDGAPPRAGKGSGRDAWADHAASLGIEVTDEATRDEIIDLVDAQTTEG